MGIRKRLAAMVLVGALAISSAFSVSAATKSPTNANKSYDTKTNQDSNTQDHVKKTVTAKVNPSKKTATVTKVASTSKKYKTVTLTVARDKNNKAAKITAIAKNSFASKKGQYIKNVNIKSKASKVTIKTGAFNKSKVQKVAITSKKVAIQKNAFKGTKAKSLTLQLKKASQLKLTKGAFNGLKKITIKGATKAQKAKIKKAIQAAGFKGTIK